MVLFLVFLFLLMYAAYFLRSTISPNLEDIAKIQARALVNREINTAISSKLKEEVINTDKLLTIERLKNGHIEMVQANAQEINLLVTGVSQEIQARYLNMREEEMQVPLGALFGSQVFSQTGPDVNVKIMPVSVSKTDFKTEFEAKGINQTKYKVHIVIESRVKVLAPFSSNTFSIKTKMLVAEAVILGDVPRSFVQVPKESTLDGMQVLD